MRRRGGQRYGDPTVCRRSGEQLTVEYSRRRTGRAAIWCQLLVGESLEARGVRRAERRWPYHRARGGDSNPVHGGARVRSRRGGRRDVHEEAPEAGTGESGRGGQTTERT